VESSMAGFRSCWCAKASLMGRCTEEAVLVPVSYDVIFLERNRT
jgi:hypothetical protein